MDTDRTILSLQEQLDEFKHSVSVMRGLERAIEIIQNEDYPESHGLVSAASIVDDLKEEIQYIREYGAGS